MAPKKPTKPNAFFMYAQNLKNMQGRKYKSMKEACEAAAVLWAQMGPAEREPWNLMARQEKQQMDPCRYTSEGLNVEQLTKEQKIETEREEKMRQDIRNQIMSIAQRKGVQGLAEEMFFVIHVNIFCYHAPEEMYYPAEISILGFNLKNGVRPENIYHQFVHPGPLPFGYKFEAKQISDDTHQIKVGLGDNEVNNTAEVFQNIIAFLEKKKPQGTKRMPVLYTEEKNIQMIRQILNQWCMDFTENEESLFKVYSLPMMFMYLKNTVVGDEVYSTITIPQRELEKDIYAYNTDIACTFHSATSKPQFCSKSVVCRSAFVICDSCCDNVGIVLEPGFHVPFQSEIPESLSSLRSASITSFATNSSRSSQAANRPRRGNDSDFETDSTTNETWESQSLISDSSTAATTINTTGDDFPALGSNRAGNALPQNSSSSTNRSYAGATGAANFGSSSAPTLPTGFSSSFNSISLNNNRPRPQNIGRGFKPKNKSGDESGSDAPPSGYASSSDGDFPPIGMARGRGRGFIGKSAPMRPGGQQQ